MFRLLTSLGMLVFASSIVLLAQTNGAKPGDSDSISQKQVPVAVASDPCVSGAMKGEQAEILTDTQGVDFGPYMTNIVKTVRQNWYNLLPPSVFPPTKKTGRLTIEFAIEKNGKIDNIEIGTPSGDVALDRAAQASIIASDPLPSLPKEFSGEHLGLRFYYNYNLTPDPSPFCISPSVDVRVLVGSTLQFSVPIGGIERLAVTWSISGPACEEGRCGTINENGLYTAPIEVPNRPTVFVEAAPRNEKMLPATTQLTIVRASPPR
jgi:TonB family protein